MLTMAITYQGYNVVALKHNKNAKTFHQVFVKEHRQRPKVPAKPDGKTMLMLNVPPYVQEAELKFAYLHIGEIVNIIFADHLSKNISTVISSQSSHTSSLLAINNKFKIAFIIFRSTKSLSKALQLNEIKLYDNDNDTILISGIEKWKQEYFNSITNEKELEQQVEQYMNEFDKSEKREQMIAKRIKNKRIKTSSGPANENHIDNDNNDDVDDDGDGWITVGKGKRGGFEQNEITVNKINAKLENDKKRKEHLNFYTFQMRESKQKKIFSLRKKFEDDKRKIEFMKRTKRLKPL